MWESLKQVLKNFWETERKLVSNTRQKYRDLANLSLFEETCRITVASFQVFSLQTDQTLLYADRIIVNNECRLTVRHLNHDVHGCSQLFSWVE